MTVQDSDRFLVNRSSNSYQVEAQNLMATIQDEDLMLVNRGGQSYKVTGAEVKESLVPSANIEQPEILAPADGAGVGGDVTYTPKTSEATGVSLTELTFADDKAYNGQLPLAWDESFAPAVSNDNISAFTFDGTSVTKSKSVNGNNFGIARVLSSFPNTIEKYSFQFGFAEGASDGDQIAFGVVQGDLPNTTGFVGQVAGSAGVWLTVDESEQPGYSRNGSWWIDGTEYPFTKDASGNDIYWTKSSIWRIEYCWKTDSNQAEAYLYYQEPGQAEKLISMSYLAYTGDIYPAFGSGIPGQYNGGTGVITGTGESPDPTQGTWEGQTLEETFFPGDTVSGVKTNTTTATGTVNSVSGQTMNITPSGSDPFVDGMVVVRDGTVTIAAPSADDLEFVGSIPTASKAITAWGVAQWIVSESSDFSSPMVTTKAIAPGTTQTLLPSERGDIVLKGDTQYWVSVSYSAYDPSGVSGESAAVTFQTAIAAPVASTPGLLYAMSAYNQPTPVVSTPPGILFQNFAAGSEGSLPVAGVGLDGKVYEGPLNLSSPLVETAKYGSDVADLWFDYAGSDIWLAIYADGSVSSWSGDSPFTDCVATEITALGGVTQVVVYKCIKADGSTGYVAYVGQPVAPRYIGTAAIPTGGGYQEIDLSINGQPPTDICGIAGDYDAKQLLMLGEDGKLYVSGDAAQTDYHGITNFGTNTAPQLVTINGADTVTFVRIATCASTYAGVGYGYASFSALTDDGDLWMAGGANSSAGEAQFQKIGSGYKSVAVGSYGQNYWYALKTDGTLACGGPKSVVETPTDLGPYAPTGAWDKLGTSAGKQNTAPSASTFLIIPN